MLGELVAYCDSEDDQVKPARVVKVWTQDCLNLAVFEPLTEPVHMMAPIKPVTSATRGPGPGQWLTEVS